MKVLNSEQEKFYKDIEKYNSLFEARLDSLKINDANFMPMLTDAFNEVKIDHKSDDQFEEFVGKYISKEAELELKRNRRVFGGCSMDLSPRYHAQEIALLAAETTKWEIFLRSHLNIMNDRFDRVSDGSYAQQGRQTYIKELEVLNINLIDLILGISIRIENPVENHYFSRIGRTGRAIAESKDTKLFENEILNMIIDNELDDYNRILAYYLFDNYNYSLQDMNIKKENQEKLKIAVSKMPTYISSKIEFQEIK